MSEPTTEKPLAWKLAQVMAAVGYVPKRGKNQFHGYNYATEADLVAAVRQEMAKHGIAMIPSVTKMEVTTVKAGKDNHDERLVTLTVDYTLTDGGEVALVVTVIGEGQDRGDKASYKAMTGATKYALLKLFLIPTGDDPELDDEEPVRAAVRTVPAQQARQEQAAREPKQAASYTLEGALKLIGDSKSEGELAGRAAKLKAQPWIEDEEVAIRHHIKLRQAELRQLAETAK